MGLQVNKTYRNLNPRAGEIIERDYDFTEKGFYVPKTLHINKCAGVLIGTKINSYEYTDDKGNTGIIDDEDERFLEFID